MATSKKNEINLTEGPYLSKIIRFSLPIMATGLLQILFNSVDGMVVGKFVGDEALAAVTSTGSLVNLIVGLFMGVSVGTNVLVAQFYGAKRALYRITLPFNLRRPEDADATACNALSYCFSTRRARDLGDSLALSRNIAAEIQMFRDWSSAAFFISSLGSFARVPGLLRATINLPRVLSSAVFSSLGDCGRLFDARLPRDENGRIAFGELTLDKIYFSGPCRRGSNIFISAYSYGGEFYLSYRYASRFVQLDETFLDLWREL